MSWLEPECGAAVTVVEARVRRVILHVRLPGPGETGAVEIHIVLLLGGVALDVENELPPRFEVPGPHLLLQHRDDRGVADVARVATLLRHVHAIEVAVWLPGDAERAHRKPLVLTVERGGHIGAVLLQVYRRVDAAVLELALDQLQRVDEVVAVAGGAVELSLEAVEEPRFLR